MHYIYVHTYYVHMNVHAINIHKNHLDLPKAKVKAKEMVIEPAKPSRVNEMLSECL